MCLNSYVPFKEQLPTGCKSMSTSNYTTQFQDKTRRGHLEHLAQKMQELNPNTLENYILNRTCVCVCVCVRARARACVRARVCHHSSPSMAMVSKQCSYTFTPAFSFMACTGTALNSSTLGYKNLNCRRVQKHGTYIFTVI